MKSFQELIGRKSLRKKLTVLTVACLLTLLFSLGSVVWAKSGDPSGAATIAAEADLAIDYVWVLISGFLVMFMQAGFALVEAGFCRAKNVVNLISKNLIDFSLGALVFFAFGYALLVGPDSGGLIGLGQPFLVGSSYDVGEYLNFFWMMVFAATAATIVSGAVAERIKFKAYLIYTVFVTGLIYPLYGHWVWGGGWLANLPFGGGHLDFAGSGVVHAVGGFVGLAGAVVLGPRFGKFRKGKPQAIPGHSMTLAALGVFILWFGWFGFNPGSTFSAHELRIAVIAVNTTLAAAAGALSILLLAKWKTGSWDLGLGLNGVLGGLVAVTAPCAWVEGWAALLIGAIGGGIVYGGMSMLEDWGVDDPVGAVSVHGFNGLWGLVAVGLFADGTYGGVTGLFFGGGFGQLVSQLIGALTVFCWSFGTGYLMFKAIDILIDVRVSPQVEVEGLDLWEHGGEAYPEMVRKGGI